MLGLFLHGFGFAVRAENVDTSRQEKGLAIATEVGAGVLTSTMGSGMRVLILSDSMGIGGFAEELDACFRACPGVAAVHTVVACGTNPLSWMKMAPYGNTSTRCGFLRFESVAGKNKPVTEKDYYGMTKGHRPSAHHVPKIEDLIDRIHPDIVVFQNGNNFFDFFKEGRVIKEESHNKLIRTHVAPLIAWLATNASSVKKFYWVSPAQAGNVTPDVQQFVFDAIRREVIKIGVMLDSRQITSYPYKTQERDKMHFWGQAAMDWGDEAFRLIARDLVAHDIKDDLVLTKRQIDLSDPPPPALRAGDLVMRLRLKSQTPVPAPESFAPYGEFLVGYLYDVLEVRSGKYDEKQMLIMHPAYIKHVKQDLSRYEPSRELLLTVAEIADDSLWATVHRRDSVGPPDLYPHMIREDMDRHPDRPDCPDCNK